MEQDKWLKEANLEYAVDILNAYKKRIKLPPEQKVITLSKQKKVAV